MPFSRGSSQHRDQTRVSCFTGGLFHQLSYQGGPFLAAVRAQRRQTPGESSIQNVPASIPAEERGPVIRENKFISENETGLRNLCRAEKIML